MEAAGLASSIITFLDLTVKVIGRTREYLKDNKNFLRTIESQLPVLARSLEILKRQALDQKVAGEPAKELYRVIEDAFTQLKHIETYVRMLKPANRANSLQKLDRAVKSVFKYDAKIEYALEKLRHLTDTLVFCQVSVSTGKIDSILSHVKFLQTEQSGAAERQDQEAMRRWLDGAPRDNYIDTCISKRAPQTCKYIFDTSSYIKWYPVSKTNPKVLWINGPPGFGKTFLSASVYTHLESTGDLVAAAFWTSEGQFSSSPLDAIPRSWLIQLVAQRPILYSQIKLVWATTKGARATSQEIWTCLKQILANCSDPIILMIDGLDEYQQQKKRRLEGAGFNHQNEVEFIDIYEFLRMLKDTIQKTPCRLLIVSQRDPEIQAELVGTPSLTHGLEIYEHCLTPEDVKEDVRTFAAFVIESKLPKKAQNLKNDLADMIAAKAEHQMLWIALQQRGSDNLRPSFSEKKLKSMVDNIPVGLENVYKTNLNRVMQLNDYDKQRAVRMLHWILHSLRPLTVHELVEAILVDQDEDEETEDPDLDLEFPEDDLPTDPNEEDVFGEIRSLCGNFVTIDVDQQQISEPGKWKVRLAHSSIRSFLSKVMPSHAYDIVEQSTLMAGKRSLVGDLCLQYLRYRDVWPEEDTIGNSPVIAPRHPLLAYAATYWPMHVTEVTREGMSKNIFIFLRYYFERFCRWGRAIRNERDLHKVGLADMLTWKYNARLTCAVGLGCQDIVKQLCELGDLVDPPESYPLICASMNGDIPILRFLLEHGAEIDRSRADDGVTALYSAALRGKIDSVRELLSKGADVDKPNHLGYSPLHAAALKGHVEIVRILVAAGADLLAKDWSNSTLLHIASLSGCSEVVSALFEMSDMVPKFMSQLNFFGVTPLHFADASGDLATVKVLLSKGADPTQIGKAGLTPIHSSAFQGRVENFKTMHSYVKDTTALVNSLTEIYGWSILHLAIVGKSPEVTAIVLDDGADVLHSDSNHCTALHYAMSQGLKEIAELLLEKVRDEDLGMVSSSGTTLLMFASQGGLEDTVSHLLNRGADIRARDCMGQSVMHKPSTYRHINVAKIFLTSPACREMLELRDNDGNTPLLIACCYGSEDVVSLLLDQGADITAVNLSGFSALAMAALNGNLKCVDLLLNRCGSTPFESGVLHAAAESGKKEVFDRLRELYALNSELCGRFGWTVLHAAALGHNVEIIRAVLEQGPMDLVKKKSMDGVSSLFHACSCGSYDAAVLLLDRMRLCQPPVSFECDDILEAVANGAFDIVRLFYTTDSERFRSVHRDSTSPLLVAISTAKNDVVRYLLENGYKALDKDHNGLTGLHAVACASSNDYSMSWFVNIDWKKELAVRTQSGLTPLLEAFRVYRFEVVQKFLAEGANIEEVVEAREEYCNYLVQGYSAMHFAVECGVEFHVNFILREHSKALEWTTRLGIRPVHLATTLGAGDLMVKNLIKKGAEVKVRTTCGETPLLLAVWIGKKDAIAVFLSEEVGPFERSERSNPDVMDLAAFNSDVGVIKILHEDGFPLDTNQPDGQTLLHMAASSSNDEVAGYLLERNPKLGWDNVDNHGWTASDCKLVGKHKIDISATPRTWHGPRQWATDLSDDGMFEFDAEGLVASLREVASTSPGVSNSTTRDDAQSTRSHVPLVVTLTADHYFLPTRTASYFELTIETCTASSIAIGVERFIGQHPRILGLRYFSHAYYGDNGRSARAQYKLRIGLLAPRYGPTFAAGDIVGCGIDYKSKQIFYTKNGVCLGVAARSVHGRFTPAFSTYHGQVRVRGNFGQSAFRFDASKHGYGNTACEQCYARHPLQQDTSSLNFWCKDTDDVNEDDDDSDDDFYP